MKLKCRGHARLAIRAMVCLVPCCPVLVGQTCGAGRLRVLVQDSTGRPISSAEVRIATGSTAAETRATSPEGIAEFTDLACGSWAVHVAKDGLEKEDRTIQVTDGAGVDLNLTLTPQIVKSSVDVHDTA